MCYDHENLCTKVEKVALLVWCENVHQFFNVKSSFGNNVQYIGPQY